MTDLTPNDLSHLSDEEFNALCPQGEHAPGPEPLSPAAQAVLDAANKAYDNAATVAQETAAVLRAASTQLTSAKAIDTLRSIAAELQALQ